MLGVLPQLEGAVEEYLGLQQQLSVGEQQQTKLLDLLAFLEGGDTRADHPVHTLEHRLDIYTLVVVQ